MATKLKKGDVWKDSKVRWAVVDERGNLKTYPAFFNTRKDAREWLGRYKAWKVVRIRGMLGEVV